MRRMLRAFAIGLAVTVMSTLGTVGAQTPAPIQGNIYAVVYVEVMPTSRAEATAVLTRYREATRRQDGNLRVELVQRIDEPHQFVVLEVWRDQAAFEAHGGSGNATQMREQIAAIRNAPTDQRVHVGLSVGPIEATAGRDAIYVVTHVDVIPPRKDDGIAAVKQLAEGGRKADDNLRFEVVQQTNRPNHFTVVEIWRDARATETHSMSATARQFRDRLAPATGALYDERKYRRVE